MRSSFGRLLGLPLLLLASCYGGAGAAGEGDATDGGTGGGDATNRGDAGVDGSRPDGSGVGVVTGDGSGGEDLDASDTACGISGDGGAGSSCECVGASPPHTLPNEVSCGPTVLGPAALCCGPAGWPLPGSSCFCSSWGCTAGTGSSDAGCTCDVEGADAGSGLAASCSPSGGSVCCAAGSACSCGAASCGMLGPAWAQVPACDVSHLPSSACQSVGDGHGPAELGTCR